MVLNFFRRKKQLTHDQIIRFVLADSGFSQKELARYLEVYDSTVHRWLIGARRISPKYWQPLLHLNSSLKAEDFLGGQNDGS
jgi:DNA-binding transcriptional regulator YiaG